MRNLLPFLLLLFLFLLCTSGRAQCPINLVINDDDDVTTFLVNAPPSCTFLSGNLTISGIAVTDVSGLSVLTSIGGNVLVDNTSMSDLDGLQNLGTISGNFTIRDCRGLSGNGLSDGSLALSRLSGYLSLENLPRLTEFLPLTNLGILSSGFGSNAVAISNLDALAGLGGSMARIDLVNNRNLTDLTGITGVALITDGVVITGNPALTDCAIAPVCAALDGGTPAIISGNAGDCASVQAVSLICSPPCSHPLYDELEQIYFQAGGDDWTNNTNWLQNCDPCTWFGITCDGAGKLTRLELPNNNLTGQLAPDIRLLTDLEFLRLNNNDFGGTSVPTLEGLTKLQRLRLHRTNFGGPLPNLGSVDFGTSMQDLTDLSLFDNAFTGTIPADYDHLSLPALERWYLDRNQLTGGLPSLQFFNNLEEFNVHTNNLSGCYPSNYDVACNFNSALFFNNPGLPDGGSTSFFENEFCQDGQACTNETCHPDWEALYAFYFAAGGPNWTNRNGWATGVLGWNCDPCTWAGVSCNTEGRVTEIELTNNNLTGQIAAQISEITFLERLDLSENALTGSFPSAVWDLPLIALDLNTNQLSVMPDAGDMPLLESISLFNNNFSTSDLPIITAAPNLRIFRARDAGFVDQVPTSYNPTEMPALEELDLSNNNLFDELPPAFGEFTRLNLLNLRNNNFIGCYPAAYAPLCNVSNVGFTGNPNLPDGGSNLFFRNQFCNQNLGCAPDCHPDYPALVAFYTATNGNDWTNNSGWLADCEVCDWFGVSCDANGRVTTLGFFNNNLTGSLPVEIGMLPSLISLDLPDNNLTGSLPAAVNQLSALVDINLQNNRLTGPLPELTGLTFLTGLNLLFNDLGGTVPAWLNEVTSLERIALSGNELTGTIPDLSALTSLTLLTLSRNNLTGELPAYLGELPALNGLRLENNDLSGCYPSTYTALCGLSNILFINNAGLPDGGSETGFADAFCNDGEACTVLPVDWLTFTATRRDKAVVLNWSTAAETGSDHFVVERSAEGTRWLELGYLPAAGNTAGRSDYSFTDRQPVSGHNYYRIRQVDLDGATDFSAIQVVDWSASARVFPNPSSAGFTVVSEVAQTITLRAATGTVVRTFRHAGGGARVQREGLKAGVYLLHFPASGEVVKLVLR